MIQIDVSKKLLFAEGHAVLHVNTALYSENITALYGPSGAGKTTLLKIIAGIIQPEEGVIKTDNTYWLSTSNNIRLPTQQRSIGFVFQDFALFPNMTVYENLLYAAGKQIDKQYINRLLEIVAMQPFIHSKPAQLSGGQQQRAALIRALVRKPALLLLDEPLSALDNDMRLALRKELIHIQQLYKFTILLVSHDVGEVYSLAMHVIRLENGRITAQGTPQQVFGSANLSSKIQLVAEVINILSNGVVYIIELLAGNNVVKVIAAREEAESLTIGDKVLLSTKAFNPVIQKIG